MEGERHAQDPAARVEPVATQLAARRTDRLPRTQGLIEELREFGGGAEDPFATLAAPLPDRGPEMPPLS